LQTIPKQGLWKWNARGTRAFAAAAAGLMWIEEQPGTTKINQMRTEEVLKTGAETVVTGVPILFADVRGGHRA